MEGDPDTELLPRIDAAAPDPDYIAIVASPLPAGLELFFPALQALVDQHKPDVVLIDPLASVIGDTRRADLSRQFGDGLHAIAHAASPRCAVLAVAHSPKYGKAKARDSFGLIDAAFSGSAQGPAAARTLLNMQCIREEGEAERVVLLRVGGNADDVDDIPAGWRIVADLADRPSEARAKRISAWHRDDDAQADVHRQAEGRQTSNANDKAILAYMVTLDVATWKTAPEIADATGIQPRTVRHGLGRLADAFAVRSRTRKGKGAPPEFQLVKADTRP